MLPPNVSITSAALGINDLVAGQLSAALSRIEEVAAELAARDVDVITMGGTPPVVFGGYGFDQKIIERINKVTPIPATTSQTSSVQAIKLLGAKKIVIVTPFQDYVNAIKAMGSEGQKTSSPAIPRHAGFLPAHHGRAVLRTAQGRGADDQL